MRCGKNTGSVHGVIDFTLVRPDRPVAAPRAARMLRVRLSGMPETLILPSDGTQHCAAEGEDWVCTLRPADWRDSPVVDLNAADVQHALQPSFVAPSRHPRIEATAQGLGDVDGDGEALARALVDWIQANVRREAVDVFTALDVLDGGRAECQGHAYLYAALARARGLPTRIVNGLVYAQGYEGFLYHTWAESWVDGHWLPVDPTFGQVPVDATHIRLVDGERLADLAPMTDAVGRVGIAILEVR